MSAIDDNVIRLGLALYEATKIGGVKMYSVHELVFDEHASGVGRLINRLTGYRGDFWKASEDMAQALARAGIAEHSSTGIDDVYRREQFVQLTDFGKKIFDLAHAPKSTPSEIVGLKREDLLLLLGSEDAARKIADDLAELEPKINALRLSNLQKGNAQAYVRILVEIARMPEPDGGLFWLTLERANQVAGIASLIVACIALRMTAQ
jgi:hypothetical protein